jgi:hypothetical protein
VCFRYDWAEVNNVKPYYSRALLECSCDPFRRSFKGATQSRLILSEVHLHISCIHLMHESIEFSLHALLKQLYDARVA